MITEQERLERQRQYEADLAPLIDRAAPLVTDQDRVLLGTVHDLVPSGTDEVRSVPEADQLWFSALGALAHRYGLTYELVAEETGRQLWLIPEGTAERDIIG